MSEEVLHGDEIDEPLDTNAVGVAVALDAVRDNPQLAGSLTDFLSDQRALIADQRHHLRKQLRRMTLAIIDERFSIVLKAMTALVGLALAGGLAYMIWDASGSGGLVIEPLSVPPDLAQRGVTGQVVAAELLDRLATMQSETDSQRDPQTYANYWGDDIKVEIPQTGVSLGELDRFLHERLGHPTHITGEIVRTDLGLALTARAGTGGSGTARGREADLDALIQQLAESIFRVTEPYRYGVYLREQGRSAEGLAVFVDLAKHGPPKERPWGYLGWANALEETDSIQARLQMMRQAVRRDPAMYLARQDIALIEEVLNQPEQAIRDFRAIAPALSTPDHGGIRPDVLPVAKKRLQAFTDLNLGAFHEAAQLWREMIEFGPQGATWSMPAALARSELGEHDLSAARATMSGAGPPGGINPNSALLDDIWAHMLIDTEAENWAGVLADDRAIPPLFAHNPGLRSLAFVRETPWIAYAKARLGDFKTAEALISGTPSDCYVCLRMRARIADLQGQHARTDWWFARAISQQNSIPFAYAEWGEALMGRGDFDGAIAKFKTANDKGPRFADPLELWGEALVLKNRSDLALARFEEAEKYAPNWGRLHLKWGEALFWLGHNDEAAKQFAIAATLDLTAADKAMLSAWIKRHG